MTCHHCGRPAIAGLELEDKAFCCPGCRGVYRFIHETGLDGYYRMRQEPARLPWEGQDLPEDSPSGPHHLICEGMHCVACVWLLEKAVGRLPGVTKVDVNYTLGRLKVDGEVSLHTILHRLRSLGYRGLPYDPARSESPLRREENQRLLRLGVAAFSAGNIMLLAFALYSGADAEPGFRALFHGLSLLLSLPVLVYSAQPFLQGALVALRERTLTADVTISLGFLVTWTYSAVGTFLGWSAVYFDTAATFIFVLLVARLLETGARVKSGALLERLLSLQTRRAVRWEDGDWREVQSDALVAGDLVQVGPGQQIPGDGRLVEGSGFLDESTLTGEANPRALAAGDFVYGGSLSVDGLLQVRLEKTGQETMLAQIARFVESCQSGASPVQRRADQAARFFLGMVLVSALFAACWWGWQRAVTVLIITCPCALGIAAPLTVAVAAGRGAGRGILFRGGAALERFADVTHLVLDKTGTLTTGDFELESVQTVDALSSDQALAWAAALERGCSHPLARALVRASRGPVAEVRDYRSEAGQGVSGLVEGRRMRIGSAGFLGLTGATGNVHLEVDGRLAASFLLRDQIRPEAAEVLTRLRELGLGLTLASGDMPTAVAEVAQRLGLDDVHPRCLPMDKVELVRRLQAQGQVVAAVGDGINDAPVLRAADVGLAVSNASELSSEAADWVLLRTGLQPLLEAIQLAQTSRRRLHASLGVALVYNLVAIPAAMLGWATPLFAAVAMPLSSLVVVFNTLLLGGPARGNTLDSDPGGPVPVSDGPDAVRLGRAQSPVPRPGDAGLAYPV